MKLKEEFVRFVKEELGIPLVGVLKPEKFSEDDVRRISPVLKLFSSSTPLAEGSESILNAEDFLTEARSVIIVGMPAYPGKVAGLEECRAELLGKAESNHVNIELAMDNMEKGYSISSFFTEKGFKCSSIIGTQYPLKLAASKCGIGFYGKNSVIQHPDFGSWIGLFGFVTDADLEPDKPIEGDCGSCELCMKACPTGAIFAPYRCDPARCIDFNLGHNKKVIPVEIRENCGNLLGEGCTICRDACPRNQKLKPLEGFSPSRDLLHPKLLDVFDMTDDEWNNGFANTLMGFFLMDKKFLQRNAAIALGNFRDKRALPVLKRVLDEGDDVVRGYAAWAIGRIGGEDAAGILNVRFDKEEDETVKREIEMALRSCAGA